MNVDRAPSAEPRHNGWRFATSRRTPQFASELNGEYVTFHEFINAVKELGVSRVLINEPPPVARKGEIGELASDPLARRQFERRTARPGFA
jgi:hypothetical protein